MRCLFIFLLFVLIPVASPVVAAPPVCIIYDASEGAANVRASPNGEVINRLKNGRVVYIKYQQNDAKGRPWAWVEGVYEGYWRSWGFVFMPLLVC